MITKTTLNELKAILVFWLLPWPTRKHNVRMWAIVLTSWLLIWWSFGLSWVLLLTKTTGSLSYSFAAVVLLMMTFYTTLAVLGDQMLRGAKARSAQRQIIINEAMRVALEAIMKQNAAGLRQMVGRDVEQNPISMTAATLEAAERITNNTPKNPLQAALSGDEDAFDQMLDDEEDNNKPF